MKRELENRTIDCPYCGESIDLLLDPSASEQSYVEDCQVCCRPIDVRVSIAPDGDLLLTATTDSD